MATETVYQVGGARVLAGRLGDTPKLLEIGLMNSTTVTPEGRVRQESKTPEGHTDQVIDYGGAFTVAGKLHSIDAAAVAAVTDYASVDGDGNLLFSDETKVIAPFSIVVVPDAVVATAGDSPIVWYFPQVHTQNLGAFVHAIADADAPVDFSVMSKRALTDFDDPATVLPDGTRFGFRGVPGTLGLAAWSGNLPSGYGGFTPPA